MSPQSRDRVWPPDLGDKWDEQLVDALRSRRTWADLTTSIYRARQQDYGKLQAKSMLFIRRIRKSHAFRWRI
jgi:hypothetical protein